MSRKSKRLISTVFIAAILFAQFTIAAHACPVMMLPSGQAGPVAAGDAASDSLPGGASAVLDVNEALVDSAPCSHMTSSNELGSSNLCAEHCNYGQQSDQNQTLTVPALAMISLYLVQPPPDSMLPAWRASASTDPHLVASPPHSILHCCFLI